MSSGGPFDESHLADQLWLDPAALVHFLCGERFFPSRGPFLWKILKGALCAICSALREGNSSSRICGTYPKCFSRPMFNLPGEINVGTNSTVELLVDEKLLEQLEAGYRGLHGGAARYP